MRAGWIGLFVGVLAAAGVARDYAYDRALEQAMAEVLDGVPVPSEPTPAFFLEALESDVFMHEAVGPFDLYVARLDELASASAAKKVMRKAAKGLEPAAAVVERHFEAGRSDDAGQPLVAGRRFPVVLTETDRSEGQSGYDQLIALLHLSENGPGGWNEDVAPLFDARNLTQLSVRTWEVLIVNLGHQEAAAQGDAFLEHGLGYHVLNHVVNRVLRLGAWGNVPPWLAQGLVDELDIEAYEKAWIGTDDLVIGTTEVSAWRTVGWSGFLPAGMGPPPPLRVEQRSAGQTLQGGGDEWTARSASEKRHWRELHEDRDEDFPASFEVMARHETFLPRDRAYARAVLHLLLNAPAPEGASLLAALDHETPRAEHGMVATEPLPRVVSRVLGGVDEVDRLEAMPIGEMLVEIGREDLRDRFEGLGAGEALAFSDHRDQAQWLYERPSIPGHRRQELFLLILEAEYFQQAHEWELIGAALDRAADAALGSTRSFPRSRRDIEKVGEMFWDAFADDSGEG